jgi:hypothetical protein
VGQNEKAKQKGPSFVKEMGRPKQKYRGRFAEEF